MESYGSGLQGRRNFVTLRNRNREDSSSPDHEAVNKTATPCNESHQAVTQHASYDVGRCPANQIEGLH